VLFLLVLIVVVVHAGSPHPVPTSCDLTSNWNTSVPGFLFDLPSSHTTIVGDKGCILLSAALTADNSGYLFGIDMNDGKLMFNYTCASRDEEDHEPCTSIFVSSSKDAFYTMYISAPASEACIDILKVEFHGQTQWHVGICPGHVEMIHFGIMYVWPGYGEGGVDLMLVIATSYETDSTNSTWTVLNGSGKILWSESKSQDAYSVSFSQLSTEGWFTMVSNTSMTTLYHVERNGDVVAVQKTNRSSAWYSITIFSLPSVPFKFFRFQGEVIVYDYLSAKTAWKINSTTDAMLNYSTIPPICDTWRTTSWLQIGDIVFTVVSGSHFFPNNSSNILCMQLASYSLITGAIIAKNELIFETHANIPSMYVTVDGFLYVYLLQDLGWMAINPVDLTIANRGQFGASRIELHSLLTVKGNFLSYERYRGYIAGHPY
jgi:hypothetical protein